MRNLFPFISFALGIAFIAIDARGTGGLLAQQPERTGGLLRSEASRQEGTSSREAKELALRAIPFGSLNRDAVGKIKGVVDSPSVFRRMPTQTITCDEELFRFLVRYPEILIEIWDLMGMTKVELRRTGPYSFAGHDGAGTNYRSELILGSEKLHVYFGSGDYEGGLFNRKLEGRCVCVIHSQSHVSPVGQALVTVNMDVFLKLDNVGADLVAKTLSPLVIKTSDLNYIESLRFVSQLASSAVHDPSAIEYLAGRLEGLTPSVREQFILVCHEAAVRHARNIAHHRSPAVSSPGLSLNEEEPNQAAGLAGPRGVPVGQPTSQVILR